MQHLLLLLNKTKSESIKIGGHNWNALRLGKKLSISLELVGKLVNDAFGILLRTVLRICMSLIIILVSQGRVMELHWLISKVLHMKMLLAFLNQLYLVFLIDRNFISLE